MIKIEIEITFTDRAQIRIRDVPNSEQPPIKEEQRMAAPLLEAINQMVTFALRLVNPAHEESSHDDV